MYATDEIVTEGNAHCRYLFCNIEQRRLDEATIMQLLKYEITYRHQYNAFKIYTTLKIIYDNILWTRNDVINTFIFTRRTPS